MTEQYCRHVVLDGNIHEFTFLETSRNAIDGLVAALEVVVRETPPDGIVRVAILNTNNKPQPVSYAVSRMRALTGAYPQRAALRSAIVEEGFFASILDGVFRALLGKRDRLRLFAPKEREKMLEWLRRDD